MIELARLGRQRYHRARHLKEYVTLSRPASDVDLSSIYPHVHKVALAPIDVSTTTEMGTTRKEAIIVT